MASTVTAPAPKKTVDEVEAKIHLIRITLTSQNVAALEKGELKMPELI
jgi:hypothetical protein